MTKYCIGCGIELQCDNPYEDGYINPEVFDRTALCRRCFRLKHYGEYKVTNKSNAYYKNIIKDIFRMNELVLHIVDIFNMGNMDYIYSQVFSPAILVISKIDVLPKSVNIDKLIEYFKSRYPRYKDVIVVSSEKNYNMDLIYKKIMEYKESKDVYVLGNSNAGKSTFINRMIKNYTDNNNFIVTSYMPSTTLNVISIKINDDFNILDTPGIINEGDINTKVDESIVKNICLKEEINPRIYQIKDKASLIIENIGRINIEDESNISIYISNKVNIERCNINNDKFKELELTNIKVEKDEELVIEGLCFIKCADTTLFEIYIKEGTDIYKRERMF